MSAFTLATAFPASGQTRIDVSSPKSAIQSLHDLAGRWTHPQFVEFIRAAFFARVPDYRADPASLLEGRNRWSNYVEGAGYAVMLAVDAALHLEGDTFASFLEPEDFPEWAHRILGDVLEDRSIEELVALGRDRELGTLTLLRERSHDESLRLDQRIEQAREVLARPGASVEDEDRLEELERQRRNFSQALDLFALRLRDLQSGDPFMPGAGDCRLDDVIDVSTVQTMTVTLTLLADTCPQRDLMAFLRAAAILAEIPAGIARPGARMHSGALRMTEDRVASAMRAIHWLPALFLLDHTTFYPAPGSLRRLDSQGEQLANILRRAMTGRKASEVIREAEKVEIAFLALLRDRYAQLLRDEIQALGPNPEASALESRRLRELRAKIARIEYRLHGSLLDDTSAR